MTILAGGVDPENVEVRAGVVLEEEARESLSFLVAGKKRQGKNSDRVCTKRAREHSSGGMTHRKGSCSSLCSSVEHRWPSAWRGTLRHEYCV